MFHFIQAYLLSIKNTEKGGEIIDDFIPTIAVQFLLNGSHGEDFNLNEVTNYLG